MASNVSLAEVLEDIVAFVEQQRPGALCSVLLADVAATTLLDRLKNGIGGDIPRTVSVEPTIIVRQSTSRVSQ